MVPIPAEVPGTRSVRGTLLIGSRAQLRISGLHDRYVAKLQVEDARALDGVVAASWIPVRVAHAHFTATDALGLSESDVLACTRPSAERLHGVFLTTAFRLVRAAGLTPWTGMTVLGKIWGRFFEGGALGVQRVGPKEARVVVAGHPLLRHRYHRIGLRAHAELALGFCCQRVIVRETACDPDAGAMTLLARWV